MTDAEPVLTMDELEKRPDFVRPKIVKEVKPSYSPGAMERKVDGIVLFAATIRTDGTIGAPTIKQFLDPQLEHQALAALRQWRFARALLAGRPIAVSVEIELSFTLK